MKASTITIIISSLAIVLLIMNNGMGFSSDYQSIFNMMYIIIFAVIIVANIVCTILEKPDRR